MYKSCRYLQVFLAIIITILAPLILAAAFIAGGIQKMTDWLLFLFDLIFGTQHHIDYLDKNK
jgi:hypothetical protein